MEQTAEKYTEARRALSGSGGAGDDHSGNPAVAFGWPGDLLGWFTDQAYNLILLADDEARMLNHAVVEPEHLLLATARRGNVEGLLAGTAARAIHAAILRIRGFGKTLELQPRPSLASQEALRDAVTAAARRGVLGPSTEYLLLGIAKQELPARILADIGVPDAAALVDAHYPVTRPSVAPAIVQRRAAQLAEIGRSAPSPGPIPPIFERFTSDARDALNAGIQHARELDDPYVEPVHLLQGTLAANGIAATLRTRFGWIVPAPRQVTRPRYRRATDIFTDDARRIVAEDVLIIAERLHHRPLTTGHLLTALLESRDERAREIVKTLPDVSAINAVIAESLTAEPEAERLG
ncbi:MAG: Clp protease N-terminal domain-containing protein [Solirubrobacteraceae bacterium]